MGRDEQHTPGKTADVTSSDARFVRLENATDYLKRDVSELRTDMRDVRDRVIRIETDISHLPTKAFVFGAFGAVTAFLTAVTVFQAQIQQAIRFASSGP